MFVFLFHTKPEREGQGGDKVRREMGMVLLTSLCLLSLATPVLATESDVQPQQASYQVSFRNGATPPQFIAVKGVGTLYGNIYIPNANAYWTAIVIFNDVCSNLVEIGIKANRDLFGFLSVKIFVTIFENNVQKPELYKMDASLGTAYTLEIRRDATNTRRWYFAVNGVTKWDYLFSVDWTGVQCWSTQESSYAFDVSKDSGKQVLRWTSLQYGSSFSGGLPVYSWWVNSHLEVDLPGGNVIATKDSDTAWNVRVI